MDEHARPTRRKLTPVAALAALALVAVACGDDAATPVPTATPSPVPTVEPTPEATPQSSANGLAGTSRAAALGDPRPAPELADLVNPDGSAFELAGFEGENVLVFFGYTHCPDVCPATIGELFSVFKESPETQAVFVSVDPERDTPEFLAEWTEYLPDNLNAVTGSPGAIRRAADNYGVKYARVETTSTAGYTMSHTADLYLIDGQGRLLHTYPFGTPAAEIVADLETLAVG